MIHYGTLGLIGLPNVGKSSFLNHLLGVQVTIVSSKPQTTRRALSGILTQDDYQIVFWDAPGFVQGEDGLFEYMEKEWERILELSDHFLVLIANDQKESPKWQKVMSKLSETKKQFYYVFTKADLPMSEYVVSLKSQLLAENKTFLNHTTHDKDRSRTYEFFKTISRGFPMTETPFHDPELVSLDRTRDIVSEFIREQCFLQLEKEIPFSLTVLIRQFREDGKMPHIEADIVVEKENHRAIVIGQGGSKLKLIGTNARKKIEELLGQKIFLGLHVSFKKNWMKNKRMMKDMGYHHDE